MSNNVYLFDPSTYDAKSVDKPLAQIMREAEARRSVEGARMIRQAWTALVNRVTGGKAAPAPVVAGDDLPRAA